jgi:hypothetical protein
MGIKKLQNLFKPTGPKKQNISAAGTSTERIPTPKNDGKSQSIRDKAEIESYIKSINEKLKDKDMAKKAAQILDQWINQKK